jgi:Ku70/Ku80 beta-barrel domain
MRAIWKGAITFGPVTVPVKLHAATEDRDLHLHQVHAADGGRIRYQRRCEVCGKVVAYEDIDRASKKAVTTPMCGSAKELDKASSLVDSLSADFAPDRRGADQQRQAGQCWEAEPQRSAELQRQAEPCREGQLTSPAAPAGSTPAHQGGACHGPERWSPAQSSRSEDRR